MTSSGPLEILALTALRKAAESVRPRTLAEQHDLAYLRSLTPGQRLQLMNEVLLRAEAFGTLKPNLEPDRPRTMRM